MTTFHGDVTLKLLILDCCSGEKCLQLLLDGLVNPVDGVCLPRAPCVLEMFAWLTNNRWDMAKLIIHTTHPHSPNSSLPCSVSDAARSVHTSCLCGPGMLRIHTAALLPTAAQQGAAHLPPATSAASLRF